MDFFKLGSIMTKYLISFLTFIVVLVLSSCNLQPDVGPQGNSNSSTSACTYNISWTGPDGDYTYAACSLNCELITYNQNVYYQLSSSTADGSASISWTSM